MSAITLTHEETDRSTGLIDTSEIVNAVTPWFPGAPAEVTASIAAMQRLMEERNWFGANTHVVSLGLRAHRPDIVELLGFISGAAREVAASAEGLAAATSTRDHFIRVAFRENAAGPMIAQAAGLTVARTYQIRDGRR